MKMKCFVLVALLIQPVWSWIPRAQSAFYQRCDATVLSLETADGCCDTTEYHRRHHFNQGRREWFQQCLIAGPSVVAVLAGAPIRSVAIAKEDGGFTPFTREAKDFAYSVAPPPGFQQTQKPVKTHLDEVNFISDTVKGYQFGITVDPVRINSLKEFGTPEQVAARVVTAEVNRDGVFEVTLMEDPYESKDGSYILNYISDGKRGKKRFLTKFFISRNQLYALTAQALEDSYSVTQKEEVLGILESFSLQ